MLITEPKISSPYVHERDRYEDEQEIIDLVM